MTNDPNKLKQSQFEKWGSTSRPFGQHEGVRIGKEIEASKTHDEIVQLVSVYIRSVVSLKKEKKESKKTNW